MRNRLDRSWWTSFSFFIAGVAISTGSVLWRAQVDETRYGDLFKMIVSQGVPPGKPAVRQPVPPVQPGLAI